MTGTRSSHDRRLAALETQRGPLPDSEKLLRNLAQFEEESIRPINATPATRWFKAIAAAARARHLRTHCVPYPEWKATRIPSRIEEDLHRFLLAKLQDIAESNHAQREIVAK